MAKENKLFNYGDYYYFALITPIPGSWGFVSYSDGEHTYEAIRGLNPQTKVAIPFDIYFSTKERVYRCGKKQSVKVIIDGERTESMPLYEYLKNHPNCQNSKSAREDSPVIFKELDEVKDAKEHTSRIKRRADAMNKALALKPAEYDDIAPLIGVFSDDPDVKQRAILMFADQDPEGFFRFVEDNAAPVRALIRKAVQMNKLKKLGESIFWDKETIGGNEDQAVSYLLANKDKHDALKMLVKKLK
jgi:hypothetical protein